MSAVEAPAAEAAASSQPVSSLDVPLAGLYLNSVGAAAGAPKQGQWHYIGETKKVSIGVDSGAAVTIVPKTCCDDYPVERNEESAKGMAYLAANDQPIYDEGTRHLLLNQDGNCRCLRARVGDVHKPLLAVCELVEAGHRVVFDSGESFILNKATGQKMNMVKRNRVFEVDLDVLPYSSASDCPFGRQAQQL